MPKSGNRKGRQQVEVANQVDVGAITTETEVVIVDAVGGDSCMDTANDALRVNVVAGSGTGSGTSMADDGAFTVGTTPFTPVGGTYNSVRDTLDDNDGGAVAINAKRGQYVTLETSASVETGVAAAPLQVSLANHAANATAVKVDGSAVTQPVSGTVTANAGTGTMAVSAAALPLPSGASTSALQTQPGVDIGDVTVNNASGASAVNIQDGGNSLTVDGTVTANAGSGTFAISAASLPLPTGAATSALQTQPGVDIGDVTVNNAAGASAVNIQDGGNSLTVDGTVTVSGTVTANAGTNLNTSSLALESGGNLAAVAASASVLDDWDESDRAKVNLIVGQAGIAAGTGVDGVTVPRVTLATNVALPSGNNNIGDVDVASSVLPAGASTLAEQQTQTASLSVLDDWDETDRAKVNIIAGQVGVAGNTGTVGATTQRVCLATDVALPAGTNNIGVVSTKTDLTPSSPTAASVGVASAQAVAANANRKGLVLVNTSSATISLGFGSAAVLNSGITLTPYGTFVMDEFMFDVGAVNAIASAAASNLAIQEYAT